MSDEDRQTVILDQGGLPIMIELADVPNAGTTTTDPNAAGGNPHHDTASGKFGAGSGAPRPQETNKPQGEVDPIEWARRLDAVREAAREFEEFAPADLSEWLKGKANRDLSEDEVNAFLADVRAQVVDDLVDLLDYKSRQRGRARRFVRVEAPRGYTKLTLGKLTDDEISMLDDRLRSRGWSEDDIRNNLVKKLPKEKQSLITFEEPDPNNPDEKKRTELSQDAWAGAVFDISEGDYDNPTFMGFADSVEKIMSKLPQPVIHVNPQITVEAPKSTGTRVVRDPVTRELIGTEPVGDADSQD